MYQFRRLRLECLEDRVLLNGHTLALAMPLTFDASETALSAGTLPATDYFAIQVTDSARLTATVHATGAAGRLSLLDSTGGLLVQSDGQSTTNPDAQIVQFVQPDQDAQGVPQPATFYLRVEGRSGAGGYTLTTQLVSAFVPLDPLDAGSSPQSIAIGDFIGNGIPDLAVVNFASGDVSVFLGLGDGAFREVKDSNGQPIRYKVGTNLPGNQGDRTMPDQPLAIVAGDFNNDGLTDLAVTNGGPETITVLLANEDPRTGKGDGTFHYVLDSNGFPLSIPVGHRPASLVAGRFTSDGNLDLAVANRNENDVSILLGDGQGHFQEMRDSQGQPQRFSTGSGPAAIVAGDFTGTGTIDLAVANRNEKDVSILLGDGQGHFQELQTSKGPNRFKVQSVPDGILAGDFTGNGILDLAVANRNSDSISVLLGKGNGTFSKQLTYAVGNSPRTLLMGDFNGDGIPDLAVANGASNDVSVLLGNKDPRTGKGDGSFQALQDSAGNPLRFGVDPQPEGIVAGNFSGAGNLDLATVNFSADDVSLLRGLGNGSFQAATRFPAGTNPASLTTGDFNGDGILDLATNNASSDDASVLLGQGDGSFGAKTSFGLRDGPSGMEPNDIVTADFNGDGRLDLATTNNDSQNVTVALGRGNGTFQSPATLSAYQLGTQPTGIVAGDFTGDGIQDLAVLDSGLPGTDVSQFTSDDVALLLGKGDGTFQEVQDSSGKPTRYALGDPAPAQYDQTSVALAAGDFNGDGNLDLVVGLAESDQVAVLLGDGHGHFHERLGPSGKPVRYTVGTTPRALAVGDFTGNGILDLAVANPDSNTISVLLGNGDGTFQQQITYAVGTTPRAIVADDLTGNGILDLAVANAGSNDISVLLGTGKGTFQPQLRFPAGISPLSLVAGDFNGDGRLSLAAASYLTNDITVLLGQGDGTFTPADSLAVGTRSVPLVADVTGDGVPDVVVVSQDGRILLRQGRADAPGQFGPAEVINPDPGEAARAVTVVSTANGFLLAALDSKSPTVSLYSLGHNGDFNRVGSLAVPGPASLPVLIASGDLNSDSRADLVVATAVTNQVFVYYQNAQGQFSSSPAYQIPVGITPSDLTLADVNGDGLPDILVSNRVSGDVSVLLNDPNHPFATALRFRAGTDAYGIGNRNGSPVNQLQFISQGENLELHNVDNRNGPPAVRSAEATAGLVAGQFDKNDALDLVVVNSGSDSFSLLRGTGAGGFLNPQTAPTFRTGRNPTAVVAADFNGDGNLDLAILNQDDDTVSIFLGDGKGDFTYTFTISAGNDPTGLSVADVNGDGKLDLLVGNLFGDVLTLLGNGDGTFKTYQRLDDSITLAVASKDHLVFGNPAQDHVVVKDSSGTTTFSQGRDNGILAPGAVKTVDVGNGVQALVVANSGANDVLVYLGSGGQFDPASVQTYFAGTDPAGITIADVNGDGIPDVLVANEGSNDVTELLGQGKGNQWTLTYGPRLNANGIGPVSTTVADVTGPGGVPDGIPDLLITNSASNTVAVLRGVGQGFFDDRQATIFSTGLDPQQALVGRFDTRPGLDLITVNAGSNDLTFFSDFGNGRSISSGGTDPLAAVAGDFNHDGRTDLLIANSGDGVISVLVPGADGLVVNQIYQGAQVPHPTDVALSSDPTQFLVTSEGVEQAVSFKFDFSANTEAVPFSLSLGISVPSFVTSNLGNMPSDRVANLFPLQGSSVATVATLLSVGEEFAESGQTEAGEKQAQTEAMASVLVGLIAPVNSGGDGEESPPKQQGITPSVSAENKEAEVTDFLRGLDEALQRTAEELRTKQPSDNLPSPPPESMQPRDELPPVPEPQTRTLPAPDLATLQGSVEACVTVVPTFLQDALLLPSVAKPANLMDIDFLAAALFSCGIWLTEERVGKDTSSSPRTALRGLRKWATSRPR